MFKRLGVLVGSACLGLLLTGISQAEILKAGKPAPAWTGKTVAGKKISSAQFKGRPVLLNFFAYG